MTSQFTHREFCQSLRPKTYKYVLHSGKAVKMDTLNDKMKILKKVVLVHKFKEVMRQSLTSYLYETHALLHMNV